MSLKSAIRMMLTDLSTPTHVAYFLTIICPTMTRVPSFVLLRYYCEMLVLPQSWQRGLWQLWNV